MYLKNTAHTKILEACQNFTKNDSNLVTGQAFIYHKMLKLKCIRKILRNYLYYTYLNTHNLELNVCHDVHHFGSG